MMAVMDFVDYVEIGRDKFKRILFDGYRMVDLKIFIRRLFKECSNQFEEDTLIENLKEEFENYLKEVKEQA